MSYENKQQGEQRNESIYTKRVKAGKRRTYFFDVRATKGSDFFITITESKKRFDDNGYDRHKIFLYKEDFNKFVAAMTETVNYVKTDLMPDFDFDAFNHDQDEDGAYSIPADGYYGELTFTVQYKGETENAFPWLYLDYNTLQNAAIASGLKCELILEGEHFDYLAKLSV